ncbi:MAG: TonB-dependent receptor [Lewinellaceae bacterium]|nr:TonB-dependent receptor [Saprospiraceae bacterium]MCB9337706.1 TonB-dependent receptor [Lewinellaceae bacterium]
MTKHLLPLFFFPLLAFTINAQSNIVHGKVVSPAGEALPSATVLIKGSTTGTASAADGTYSLKAPADAVLIFKYLGYETQEIAVAGKTELDVEMAESANQLDEVVVLGFGDQRRRQVTSSISTVGAEVFSDVSVPSFQRALQGRMPGVVVTNASGGLNAEAIIRLRGTGSISAGNQPLVVVDGLVLASRPGSVLGYTTNPYIALDANDIESVEVLKDAAAAAIYGSRGSNGVILISTKSGKFNAAPKVSLGYYAGFSEISKKRDLLTGPEYATLWNVAAVNAGETNPAVFYDAPAAEPTTNWQDLLLRKGWVQEANVSVSGGSPNTKYYIGGSVRDEDFYLRTIGLKRYSIRSNFEQKINDRLTAGISINPSQVIDDRTGNQWAGSAWGATSWYHPNVVALDENGECRREPLISSNGQVGDFIGNPCTVLEDQWIEATRSQLLLNAHLAWEPRRNLRFTTAFGTEYSQEKQDLRFGAATWFGQPSGWALSSRQEVLNYNWTTLANWRTAFGNGHGLEATAGFHLTRENHDFLTVDGSGFAGESPRFVGSAAQIEYVGTFQSEAAFLGYMARLNYDFNNKYLLTLSARYDGSSRFGSENRYGFFPALSAGWVVSQEDFLKIQQLDFLKLRASIGLAGNANINDFAARGLVNFNPEYAGEPGFVIQSIENDGLGWEKNLQWDAGLEFSLWNGRVNGSVEYFIKETSDLLLEKPVPATNGISVLTSNVGKVRNQGLEFFLDLGLLKGDFNWNLQLNGATLKNEVLQLADQDGDGQDDDIILNGRSLFRPGESAGSFYLVEYAGVNPNNGDALFYDIGGNIVANDASDANRKVVGRSIPIFTGGFTNVFQYKNFDLTAFFHFKTGHKIYMEDSNMEQNGTWGDNQNRNQLDYWTPTHTETDVPQPRLYVGNGTHQSTRYLDSGDFLRLQNLRLGYTFCMDTAKPMRLNVFAAAQNLLTFTKFRGLDPDSEFYPAESAGLGAVRYNLPAARTYTLGFSLDF